MEMENAGGRKRGREDEEDEEDEPQWNGREQESSSEPNWQGPPEQESSSEPIREGVDEQDEDEFHWEEEDEQGHDSEFDPWIDAGEGGEGRELDEHYFDDEDYQISRIVSAQRAECARRAAMCFVWAAQRESLPVALPPEVGLMIGRLVWQSRLTDGAAWDDAMELTRALWLVRGAGFDV